MTQEHPHTPSPELVEQWYDSISDDSTSWKQEFAIQAARWGADQELEACCEWLATTAMTKPWETVAQLSRELRNARRPKPPSLKEQALTQVESVASDD